MVQNSAYLQQQTDSKDTLLFDVEYLRNSTRYRHSNNGILIGTYTFPSQWCNFTQSWVTQKQFQQHTASLGLPAIAELLVNSKFHTAVHTESVRVRPSWIRVKFL